MEGNNKRKMTEPLEEADLKSFPADSNISAGLRCYFLKLVGDLRFEDVVGPTSLGNLSRREFVVRLGYKNILLERQDETIKSIQKDSGATIAIISDPERRLHSQARLEVWGTNEQVQAAEVLIIEAMSKMYPKLYLPTILMRAPFYHTEVYIPIKQGVNFHEVYELELQSGAWIQMDSVEDIEVMKRFKIFGSRTQIYRVLIIVHKAALKPYIPKDQESAKLEDGNKQQNVVYVPLGRVSDSLLGASFDKVHEMEAKSGAKIELDLLEDHGEGHLQMIRLKIFGNRAQIYRVLTMVHKAALEPYIPEDQESAKLEDESKQHCDSKHVKEAKDNEVLKLSPIPYFSRFKNPPPRSKNFNPATMRIKNLLSWKMKTSNMRIPNLINRETLMENNPVHQIPIPPPYDSSEILQALFCCCLLEACF